ncbi:hypothetical protein [Phenylobacterium sp.]|jgi:hypothetical protein|uniref:hypothetical protein n=1 Tax=Phenylobacterium sp. TaxID=1871053 RepID=UPI002F3EDE00
MPVRKILAILVLAGVLPLAGCMVAEVAAAPIVAPVMAAGMFFGDDPERFHRPKLRANLLDKPGVYRLFAADPQTPAAVVSVHRDLGVRFAAEGCVLEGTLDRQATRKVPSGTWPQGRVYRVTQAEGYCAEAGLGRHMLMRPGYQALQRVQAKDFPLGNSFDVALWADICCSDWALIRPLPVLTRIEAGPPA